MSNTPLYCNATSTSSDSNLSKIEFDDLVEIEARLKCKVSQVVRQRKRSRIISSEVHGQNFSRRISKWLDIPFTASINQSHNDSRKRRYMYDNQTSCPANLLSPIDDEIISHRSKKSKSFDDMPIRCSQSVSQVLHDHFDNSTTIERQPQGNSTSTINFFQEVCASSDLMVRNKLLLLLFLL